MNPCRCGHLADAALARARAPKCAAEYQGRISGPLLDRVAAPDAAGKKLLTDAAGAMRLSARGYHRVLHVARTLANLEGNDAVRRIRVAEALGYRRLQLRG